jgi:hypothetical protein
MKMYPILVPFEKRLNNNYKALLTQSRMTKVIAYTYSLFPQFSGILTSATASTHTALSSIERILNVIRLPRKRVYLPIVEST